MGFLSRLFGGPQRPAPPKVLTHEAFDGAIRVFETPTTAGWESSEAQRTGDGFAVMVLKYVLPLEPMPLALLAKVYTIEPTRPAPEAPDETDWQAVFQSMYSTFSSIEKHAAQQLTMKSTIAAMEAVIVGVGADPAVPLRIRERRAVVGQEQFIVTAMGPPSAFEEHATEIAQWFSTVAFVPIGDLPQT